MLEERFIDLRDETPPSDLSNVTINGEPQTWRQLYEREKDERQALDAFRRLAADLSRCQHGRHEGDVCSECGGPSKGNPFIRPGTVLGYDISARPYIVPSRWQLAHISAWVSAPQAEGGGER